MSFAHKISRRVALMGQSALAMMAAVPALAKTPVAAAPTGLATERDAAPVARLPARWSDATAEELTAHIGERFRFKSAEHGNVVMRLVDVEAGRSGAARPAHLQRRESVVAVFDSPDKAPLVEAVDGVHRVSHPVIGTADLYAVAVPRRNGDHHVEIVLN